jgi:hypothetical protein
VATTRDTSFAADRSATYRVGAAANYRDEQNGSDLMLIGPPVTVP